MKTNRSKRLTGILVCLVCCTVTSTAADPLPDGIHYTFNGNLRDSGPAANHIRLTGTAQLSDGTLTLGESNGSMFVDGNPDSRAQLRNPVAFTSTQPWTVTWWARRNELGGSRGMVMGELDSIGNFIWLNDSQRGLRFRNGLAASFDFTTPKDSGLHHYALVADGEGALHLYLDGAHSQTLSGETDFVIDSIGQGFTTTQTYYGFNGWLDEVRILPAALGAAQIESIYTSEKPQVPAPAPQRLLVYLLGGQSNAVGHGVANELPRAPTNLFFPQEDVDFFYHFQNGPFVQATVRPGVSRNGSFGPEINMARQLADIHAGDPDTRVALIKYAHGGTNLHTQWRGDGTSDAANDGPEYRAFQETVQRGLAAFALNYPDAEIVLVGMAWMQGESDRDPRFNGDYEDNLRRFIADVRATFRPDLPFVIGRLADTQTAIAVDQLAVIQNAQDAVADSDPLTTVVNTNGWEMQADRIHFDTPAILRMGRAFAEKLAYLDWVGAAVQSGTLDLSQSDPQDPSPFAGRTNYQAYMLDWGEQSGEEREFAQQGGIQIATSEPDTPRLRFLSSSRRIYQLHVYNQELRQWQPHGPPWRGQDGVRTLLLPLLAPVAFFRLSVSLPTSQS